MFAGSIRTLRLIVFGEERLCTQSTMTSSLGLASRIYYTTPRNRFVSRELMRVNIPSLHNEAQAWWRNCFHNESFSKKSHYCDVCNTIVYNGRLTCTYIFTRYSHADGIPFISIYETYAKFLFIPLLIDLEIWFSDQCIAFIYHQRRISKYTARSILLKN